MLVGIIGWVIVKGFYLLLYSIALRTLLLSPPNVNNLPKASIYFFI